MRCRTRAVQLKPAVAELMAAVRALPPLSMEALGAAARLSLPQIGCSNPGCVSLACFWL